MPSDNTLRSLIGGKLAFCYVKTFQKSLSVWQDGSSNTDGGKEWLFSKLKIAQDQL